MVPDRMPAPRRCCPRYTSRWLFTVPLLGDRLVFILVIWQRRSGTDESGAGRGCFATFPLPHHGGFPKTAFPYAVPAACPVGPWSLGWGPWSLGWGEWSLGWRMIPGVEGMVPGIAPRDRSPVLEAAQCRSSKPKVGQSRFSGSSQRSDPSQNLLEPSMPQFPKL